MAGGRQQKVVGSSCCARAGVGNLPGWTKSIVAVVQSHGTANMRVDQRGTFAAIAKRTSLEREEEKMGEWGNTARTSSLGSQIWFLAVAGWERNENGAF